MKHIILQKLSRCLSIGLGVLILSINTPATAQNTSPSTESTTENPITTLYPLIVHTQQGEVKFMVEVAQTPQEMSQGLMFRQSMPDNQGMLFLHKRPSDLRMWMKNTLIPLDMLFIDQWATIRYIHSSATPHDEKIIRAPFPSIAVLELNAGAALQLGIAVGDTIRLSETGG